MKKLTLCFAMLLFACTITMAQNGAQYYSKKQIKDHFLFGTKLGEMPQTSNSVDPFNRINTPDTSYCCNGHHEQLDAADLNITEGITQTPFVCGVGAANDLMRKRNPNWRSEEQFEQFMKAKSGKLNKINVFSNKDGRNALYKIPVIVHVLYYTGQDIGTEHNLSAEQIYSQFEVLNEDYRRKINTRGYNNDPVGADAQIEFVPALYDPTGNLLPEPGINRVAAETVTDGIYSIASDHRFLEMNWVEWLKEQTSWEPTCYLNMWSVGLTGGLLGYATLPDTDLPGIGGLVEPTPATYEGVVIDFRRLGSYEKISKSSGAQDSKGRTATHEIGHFLGLRHTWGDAPSDNFGKYPEGCLFDDYVSDTPASKQPMYINTPLYLCGVREMIENQMDYSNDHVKNTFTAEQVKRMHTVMQFSPRRKELNWSTVASKDGDKSPIVKFSALRDTLKIKDVFAFQTQISRFPGSYNWTFEGGIPATSSEKNPGVYFTTPGRKKITLTITNQFGATSYNQWVEVEDFKTCEALYTTSLAALPKLVFNPSFGGGYMTGHADVYGIKAIANKFDYDKNAAAKHIAQIELRFNRFVRRSNFNPNQSFEIQILEVDAEGKPGSSICTQKVRAGDAYDAFRVGKTLTVKLDNPVKPSGDAYFVMLDLDFDYKIHYTMRPRTYSFELYAGVSPINYSWVYSPTFETINDDEKVFEWLPYTASDLENGWGASVLMHLLPKLTTDTTQAKPQFTLPSINNLNEVFKASLQNKPTEVQEVKWYITKQNGDTVIYNRSNLDLSYSVPGKYAVTATYSYHPCVQMSTTKEFIVKGILFDIVASKVNNYCETDSITLSVNQKFASAPVTYTWSGLGIPVGTTGTTIKVAPGVTSTYTATANSTDGQQYIQTIELIQVPATPKADWEILASHYKVNDSTIALYINNAVSDIEVANKSENAYTYDWQFDRVLANGFEYVSSNYGQSYENFRIALGSSRAGLHRLRLQVTHSGCGFSSRTRDVKTLFVDVKGQASFGEVGFTANNVPLSSTPSSLFPQLSGAYTAYVSLGDSVRLSATSNEIKSIKWTNRYNQKEYDGLSVTLANVRDRVWFDVNCTRERIQGKDTIQFTETLVVAVLLAEDAPKGTPIADFYTTSDTICVGKSVKFVNTSRNASGFKWTYEGGIYAEDERLVDLSTLWSPNRTYPTAGNFKVKLSVFGADGTEYIKEKTITVLDGNKASLDVRVGSSGVRIIGDSLFTYNRNPISLVVTGNSLSGTLRYSNYLYNDWRDVWWWLSNTRQDDRMRPSVSFDERSGLVGQLFKITAFGCSNDTLVKVLKVNFADQLRFDDFALTINDTTTVPFTQFAELGVNQVDANVAFKLRFENLKNKNVSLNWYKKTTTDRIYLGSSLEIVDYPSENTVYQIEFTNKIGDGFIYNIPVQTSIDNSNFRVMNQDLELNDSSTIILPLDYATDIVLWIDNVKQPVWEKLNPAGVVLSTEHAVVLPPKDGVYKVTALAGPKTFVKIITVKTTPDIEEPGTGGGKPDETGEGKAIQLFPVPAHTELNVISPYSGAAYILDARGRLIKRFTLMEGSSVIRVNEFAAGVYKLLVQLKDGRFINRSFIVVH